MAVWSRTIEGFRTPSLSPWGPTELGDLVEKRNKWGGVFTRQQEIWFRLVVFEIFVSVLILQGTTEKLISLIIWGGSLVSGGWLLLLCGVAPASEVTASLWGVICLAVKGSFSSLIKILVDQFCCLWCQMWLLRAWIRRKDRVAKWSLHGGGWGGRPVAGASPVFLSALYLCWSSWLLFCSGF